MVGAGRVKGRQVGEGTQRGTGWGGSARLNGAFVISKVGSQLQGFEQRDRSDLFSHGPSG